MECVLRIMLEVENLTPNQKVYAQNGLEALHLDDRSQPAQSRYAYQFLSNSGYVFSKVFITQLQALNWILGYSQI